MATKKVILNGETIIDLSDTTATEATVASGCKFYDAHGNACYGYAEFGGGSSGSSPSNNYNTRLRSDSCFRGLFLQLVDDVYHYGQVYQLKTKRYWDSYSGYAEPQPILGSDLTNLIENYTKLQSIVEKGSVVIESTTAESGQLSGMSGDVYKTISTSCSGSSNTHYSTVEYRVVDAKGTDLGLNAFHGDNMLIPIYFEELEEESESTQQLRELYIHDELNARQNEIEGGKLTLEELTEWMEEEAQNLNTYRITFELQKT